jgi:hypothetical protein
MAEYKGIKGFKVQYLDQDPVPAVAGWSSGGNLNIARTDLAGAGTQTSTVVFGGYGPIPVGYTSATEEYDGASWATSNPLNTARGALGGTGTQTAGLAFGGQIPPLSAATEEYDGNSWTNSNPLNTARVG